MKKNTEFKKITYELYRATAKLNLYTTCHRCNIGQIVDSAKTVLSLSEKLRLVISDD